MADLKNKTLALFFTCGVSLEIWERMGNLEREIKPYNELAKYFKKIYFITYGGRKELSFQNKLSDNIEILPKKSFLPSLIYQFFIPIIYRQQIKSTDIYKTNQMASAVPVIISKWLYKKEMILRCGYELLNFLEKSRRFFIKKIIVFWLEKIAYKSADKIVVASHGDKKFIENKFGCVSAKIEVVANYIDTDLFKPLKINKEKSRVIFVGRLCGQKNITSLVEAISNDYKLVLIGSGSLLKEIKSLVAKRKLKVEFKENIPNKKLPEELNKSDIFILPSLYEGCPKSLLEAMSCGLPCVGTNIEGIKEIIQHKKNGYLCDTSVRSIKEAISELLDNQKLKERISNNARETILENFSLEKILDKEVKIYAELCG